MTYPLAYTDDFIPAYDPAVPLHYWVIYVTYAIDQAALEESRRNGGQLQLTDARRVSSIMCAYCNIWPDGNEDIPCTGRDVWTNREP